MRFVFALVAFNALLVLASAVTYGSLEPVGRQPGVATSNNSIVENGGYHLTHHKPRFSDRNFDYDSLVDAETENADRLEEENSPLLQQSSENENGADNDNEVETTEENGINIVKNTFVGGPSTRRKKDLYVGPEDKAKGKQVENTKVKKDSVHGNTRRKKQLSKPNTTPKKIMALTVILMLAVVNPFNLFLVYPAMKAMNKDHHPPERTIISLNSLTKCETSNKDPTQKLCKIEMDDTDYGGQYEIYVKTPNDDDHLSLITKVDPDECKVGTNVVIEKWHTGEVRARCEKNVGLVDLDHPQNKIKLNPEEAKKVKKCMLIYNLPFERFNGDLKDRLGFFYYILEPVSLLVQSNLTY
uniref:Uncharacterized protein n=3 Tax=Meloidogyne TaxID=189290 RepID=A0A6V7XEF9_MELEN|nr:unnamed protein product [Meloidogyne enterolobii]